MFGLSSMPSNSTRCCEELVEHRCAASRVVTSNAALDRVVAVHQHLGLDDRHDARFLAQRGVARERVRVHVDAVRRRDAVADVDVRRAPLGEARAELAVLGEPLAQAVETLGDGLALGDIASGIAPVSTLMPGMIPCSSSSFTSGVPSAAVWRIVSSKRITPLM